MGLREFFGILPPKIWYSAVASEPESLRVPGQVAFLWPGADPATVDLRVGEELRTGQLVGAKGAADLISRVTGKVAEIDSFTAEGGAPCAMIGVETREEDLFDESIEPIGNWSEAEPQELVAALVRAGFPGFELLARAPGLRIDSLVVSALDRDALAVVNQEVLGSQADQVGPALALLERAAGAASTILAVPENLSRLALELPELQSQLRFLPAVYPNGLPAILAQRLGAGRLLELSGGGYIGNTLVVGLEHAVAMVSCLEKGRPFIEKIVTCSVGGSDVLRNLRVRIGAPVSDLLWKLGHHLEPGSKLILDGAMSGRAYFSCRQPVTETTESLHVQRPGEILPYEDGPCTNCGRCNAVCPVGLEAGMLGRCSEYGLFSRCRRLGADNCVECGLCAFVCPARRPLVQYIVLAKGRAEDETPQGLSLEAARQCRSCGPSCPALRLFDDAAGAEED